MKTLLVPVDFSPVSMNAVHYAVDMAMDIGASIVLANMYEIPVTFTEVPVAAVSLEEMKHLSETMLANLKTNLEHQTDGKLKIYTASKLGAVTTEVEALCEKLDPLAVVMGTKGATGLERLFVGSNTLSLIRSSHYPILVVPPGAVYKKIEQIGFASDINEVVKVTPVPVIKKLMETFQAKLYVLHVDYENRNFKPETPEETLLLHTLLADCNPSFEFIENKDVATGIHEFAEKHNLDLLITIPKNHTIGENLFARKHTKDLVFESHIPILCVHS